MTINVQVIHRQEHSPVDAIAQELGGIQWFRFGHAPRCWESNYKFENHINGFQFMLQSNCYETVKIAVIDRDTSCEGNPPPQPELRTLELRTLEDKSEHYARLKSPESC